MDHEKLIDVFSCRDIKSGKVFIYWRGRKVRVLTGMNGCQFLDKIKKTDPPSAQLLMARVTGNFKRGNERIPPIEKWKRE